MKIKAVHYSCVISKTMLMQLVIIVLAMAMLSCNMCREPGEQTQKNRTKMESPFLQSAKYELIMCNVGEDIGRGSLELPNKLAYFNTQSEKMIVWRCNWPNGIPLAIPTITYRTSKMDRKKKVALDEALKCLYKKGVLLVDLTMGNKKPRSDRELKAVKLICRWPVEDSEKNTLPQESSFQQSEFIRYHDFAVIIVYFRDDMLKGKYPAFTYPCQLFADYSDQPLEYGKKLKNRKERTRFLMEKQALLRDSRYFLEIYHSLSKTLVPTDTLRRPLQANFRDCDGSPYCKSAVTYLQTPIMGPGQVMLSNSWLLDKWPETIYKKPIDRKKVQEKILKYMFDQ